MPSPAELLRRFTALRVVVIGDAMLDSYLEGSATRLCPEGPVPIIARRSEQHYPGGAANSAANARALGAEVIFIAIAAADDAGRRLCQALRANGVDPAWMLIDPRAATLHKQRVYADGQCVVRWDEGDLRAAGHTPRLLETLDQVLPGSDAVIVADYGYGTLSPELIQELGARCRQRGAILAVDSKRLRHWRCSPATIITPNLAEALALVEPAPAGRAGELAPAELEALARRVLGLVDTQHVAITLSERGALLVGRDGPARYVPGQRVPRADVAGAGDTFNTATALALAAGAEPLEAVRLAVAAASIAVTRPHTAVVGRQELLQRVSAGVPSAPGIAELATLLAAYRRAGKTVVFTNGVWDLLHAGHVDFLRRARSLGDLLVVAVNDDTSARRIKGDGRPIVGQRERLAVVAALESVDHVLLYGDDTPTGLIMALRPDIHAKGGDYDGTALPEATAVHATGGRIEILPLAGEISTSALINAVVARMATARQTVQLSSVEVSP